MKCDRRSPPGPGARAASLVLLACLAGCAPQLRDGDPCALANRDATFRVLLENSAGNTYNACLDQMRDAVLQGWAAP